MSKAIFLDRDGTINIEKNYLYKIEDFEYLSGVKEALRMLQDQGYLLIIITNQSGIARGYYTEGDYCKLNEWMIDDLAESGIYISASYYCPHHPEAKVLRYRQLCQCRKPLLALFVQAIQDFDIDVSLSYAIGDKERDLCICKQGQGCRGFHLYSNQEIDGNISYIKGGLLEAANRILEQGYK